MVGTEVGRSRLCLVTPADADPAVFAAKLGDALAGGDVASLIVTGPAANPEMLQDLAELCVPLGQERGVAVLIHNDTRIAGRARADGVHIDTGPVELEAAIAAFRPKKIVGAGNLRGRHEAMLAAEADADYLFFGRLDGDNHDDIFARTFDLASWWTEIAQIPAVVMGGKSLASVRAAAAAGIEFVALRSAVWDHSGGPGAGVAEANRLLASIEDPVP